jgi:hypothetical protein
MASSRRRSSGFSEKPEGDTEAKEVQEVQEFLDQTSTEVFETISQMEKEPVQFVEEFITPSDAVPRFVEDPAPAPIPETPVLAPRPQLPRRPRRNVPRFSRIK